MAQSSDGTEEMISEGVLEKIVLKKSRYPDETPRPGDLVKIHYVGYLEDGTVFDSSRYRDSPFAFNIGEVQVIDGWDILIAQMAIGEEARLRIPPEFAYGIEGVEPIIPPNETLTFEVELLDIGRWERPDIPVDEEDSDEEEEEKKPTDLCWAKDPDREAGQGPGYKWKANGSGKEINIRIPLSKGKDVSSKDVKVEFKTHWVKCQIKEDLYFEGELCGGVDTDDSFWDIEKSEEGKFSVVISLCKLDGNEKWEGLLKSDIENIRASEEAAKAAAEVVTEAVDSRQKKSLGFGDAPNSAPEVVDVETVE